MAFYSSRIQGISKQEINKYANDKKYMSLKTGKTISLVLNLPNIDSLYEWTSNK